MVVFTGTSLLPAMDRKALKEQVNPLLQAGVKVDRKTIIIKLLESHHPIARAGQVTIACLLAGLLLWILGQLPW